MPTEAGEYIVGAYLQHVCECDIVQYNVRLPGGGLKGLREIDVVGLNLAKRIAYLCEVKTHIRGVRPTTVKKIRHKYRHQRLYAKKRLAGFDTHHMFWSPVVPRGRLTRQLRGIRGLELMTNSNYRQAVERLKEIARQTTHDTSNPFMRTLQILEHLRDD